ncbi:MAG: hypothetical protein F7C35_04865 [Desulfurococcales archaeon]|nr:hypothetical protein [Desulfurococcales archaeon]
MSEAMVECVRGGVEGCGSYIVCSQGLREAVAGEISRFKMVPIGNVTTSIDMENDRVYYLYVNENGAGFFIWATLEGLAGGECGPRLRAEVVPLVQSALADDPRLMFITMIIEQKMLR